MELLSSDPMFLAAYAEKAGSGILDMMRLYRNAALREPSFRQAGRQFVQTIWRPKGVVGSGQSEQVTEQVTEQVARLHRSLSIKPVGTKGIMRGLRLRHRPTFIYDYLQPALNAQYVEMTQPNSPNTHLLSLFLCIVFMRKNYRFF